MNSKYHDTFDQGSPSRAFQHAERLAKTYSKFYQMPLSPQKNADINLLADYRREQVQVAVLEGNFQNELYRAMEMKDQKKRGSIMEKELESDIKVRQNHSLLSKKLSKKHEKYNKHVEHEQKHLKSRKDEKAVELRQELLKFYDKEAERKKLAGWGQVKVGTCYQDAIDRMDNQHLQNQEYSLKSERELDSNLSRNNHRYQIVSDQAKAVSLKNWNKHQTHDNCQDILLNKEHDFVQTYCRDMDQSKQAFRHKNQDKEKQSKRVNQFFKKRVEHWKECKKRVDGQKEEIPHKCISILEKTNKSAFRNTMSSFRSSSKEWHSKVQQNKTDIRERDEQEKDKIMEIHNDLTLRNTTSFKVNQKMDVLRLQARKLAHHYL